MSVHILAPSQPTVTAADAGRAPRHHHLLRRAKMLGLLLILLPSSTLGLPYPTEATMATSSCGCITLEEADLLTSSPLPSMAQCSHHCSTAPFFIFPRSPEAHLAGGHGHAQGTTTSHGSCLCGKLSMVTNTCSESHCVEVLCGAAPTLSLASGDVEEEEGRADYTMMALILLGMAMAGIGFAATSAVWQARRRRTKEKIASKQIIVKPQEEGATHRRYSLQSEIKKIGILSRDVMKVERSQNAPIKTEVLPQAETNQKSMQTNISEETSMEASYEYLAKCSS